MKGKREKEEKCIFTYFTDIFVFKFHAPNSALNLFCYLVINL
jgi:hypothetical protein